MFEEFLKTVTVKEKLSLVVKLVVSEALHDDWSSWTSNILVPICLLQRSLKQTPFFSTIMDPEEFFFMWVISLFTIVKIKTETLRYLFIINLIIRINPIYVNINSIFSWKNSHILQNKDWVRTVHCFTFLQISWMSVLVEILGFSYLLLRFNSCSIICYVASGNIYFLLMIE